MSTPIPCHAYHPFIMICLDYSGGGVDLATCLRQHQQPPTARYAVIRFSRGALMGHSEAKKGQYQEAAGNSASM